VWSDGTPVAADGLAIPLGRAADFGHNVGTRNVLSRREIRHEGGIRTGPASSPSWEAGGAPLMVMETLRGMVTRHPRVVVAFWLTLAAIVQLAAPSLTRLAAEGQARLVPEDAESSQAAALLRQAWPDQASVSNAVVLLRRGSGLTDADRAYAAGLATALVRPAPPEPLLRILGPASAPEVARYLSSNGGRSQMLVAQLNTSFVAPAAQDAVDELMRRAAALPPPAGLEVVWTGDAVLGLDYMRNVQRSLDRAALATVGLLLVVLLLVYRSLALAIIPLATIGVGLVLSRGLLAWMTLAGWEMSPLVELFLVVILFGCGTDFCLFLSWRFGEHWNPANPAGAMRATLQRAVPPLLTSAGTVIVGLSMMGLTRFKLFSATGPSVALGLALTLVATLTLTPALLILLARYRPRAFAGLTAPSSGFWDRVGRAVLDRPLLTWAVTIALMLGPAVLGTLTVFTQDLVAELPADLPAVRGMALISEDFGAGRVAPLTVLIKSDTDLGNSEGLALIDDVSRLLSHQRRLIEVRSATQPLGSTAPLEPARLGARLGQINEGFGRMVEGAEQLRTGLTQGAARLRTAMMLEEMTGLSITGAAPPGGGTSKDPVVAGFAQATGALFGVRPGAASAATPPPAEAAKGAGAPAVPDARDVMFRELTRAAEGATQISEGARRARHEVTAILNDPVGRHALDRLLITPENIRENPDLRRAFSTYISPDGRMARIDLVQADRIFSAEALDQVERLRRQLREWMAEVRPDAGRAPGVALTGPNAGALDTRTITRRDQIQSWVVVPLGVFLILVLALRDPAACLNLVATMVLSYLFALGVTHLVFVTLLGAEGLDWKVPYFLFVLLVAVGVDYNVFLMSRLQEETAALGLKAGIIRAVAQTGGLISSAAAITACSFAALVFSPLSSLRQLGLALVVGIAVDALLVRPVLVPCGQLLMNRKKSRRDAAGRGGGALSRADLARTLD
jgi:RND superfamily putative drug exporter